MRLIARFFLSIMILVIICANSICSKDLEQGNSWTGTLKDGTIINVEDLKSLIRKNVSENMSYKNWLNYVGKDINYFKTLPKE